MKVIYGIGNLLKGPRGLKVVALGVFDGVHRGHRLILRRVAAEAKKRNMISVVVTFRNHPSEFFSSGNLAEKVPHLTSLEHKLFCIGQEGIDACYVIDFDKAFADTDPVDFIREVLIRKLRMFSLYVGEDFLFGKRAKGNISLLKILSCSEHFHLHVLSHFKLRNRIVSSTLIRGLIRQGNLKDAQYFLGRRVSFFGEVIHGEGRGRDLGFPTANIVPHHEVLAPDGIYATQAVISGRVFKSVTYIGTKPTFKDIFSSRSIEVFLLDFGKNIYGKKIEVRFFKKIRNDRKFLSVESLVVQMKKDVAAAKKILS